jgi:hypothetical protein
MPVRFRKLLMMVLLMVMPLQGVAAAIHAIACAPASYHAGTMSEMQADHSGDHHSHATHTAHAADEGPAGHAVQTTPDAHALHDHGTPQQHSGSDSDANYAGHLCCHHAASAATFTLLTIGNTDLPVYLSSLSLLETLFFPEQPQRPPRI